MPSARMKASPVKVAIVNDYEIVVAGLARMFEHYQDRIELVELAANGSIRQPADVVLYDTYSQPQIDTVDFSRILRNPKTDRIAVYSWNVQPELVTYAAERGAHGYISKTVAAASLVDALERIVGGEFVVLLDGVDELMVGGDWPGRSEGLTQRESEVVALVTQGHSNKEIAERTFLSINSVKAYLKSAYRKMQVSRRSQAVMWGIRHGFEPDVVRIANPEDVLLQS